jgi:hypothetical protein
MVRVADAWLVYGGAVVARSGAENDVPTLCFETLYDLE